MRELTNDRRRPAALRRSWLFLPGADAPALKKAPDSGADALIQELEDFVPAPLREDARRLIGEVVPAWRGAGVVAGVRINPFWDGGVADLEAAMPHAPDFIALPKVSGPSQIVDLDRLVTDLERRHGLAVGETELVPNIESAVGLLQTMAIARASPRVTACLVASEDMAADLGAERGPDGAELAYVRSRFLIECVAAGVVAVDCPFTWSDDAGAEADTKWARRLGYRAKSAVLPAHVKVINAVLTPSAEEAASAAAMVAAFEAARAEGRDRVEVDGVLVEVPTYASAKRLLARARALGVAGA